MNNEVKVPPVKIPDESEIMDSIVNGISKLNTESITIDTGTKYVTNCDENLNLGTMQLSANLDKFISSTVYSGNVIGSSMKSVIDRITDKNIYYIVLKSGMEVECFATDMTNILEMMSNEDLYVVQENNHPGYSTFINKEDVSYFRCPSNVKGMIKPWK